MLQMEQVLEGLLWEALWLFMSVPEILQMRAAAQAWNNVSRYGPYCEVFLFLMKNESAGGEAFVGTPFGLCDCMRTLDSTNASADKSSLVCVISFGPSIHEVLSCRPAQKGDMWAQVDPWRHEGRRRWPTCFGVFVALSSKERVLAVRVRALVPPPLPWQCRVHPHDAFLLCGRIVL